MKKNRILGFCLSQLLLLGTVASASGATAPAAPVSLDGEWELSYWPQPEKAVTDPAALSGIEVKTIPAKVPGNVELDLLAAGLIDDPMIGANLPGKRPALPSIISQMSSAIIPQRSLPFSIAITFIIAKFLTYWLNGVTKGG